MNLWHLSRLLFLEDFKFPILYELLNIHLVEFEFNREINFYIPTFLFHDVFIKRKNNIMYVCMYVKLISLFGMKLNFTMY